VNWQIASSHWDTLLAYWLENVIDMYPAPNVSAFGKASSAWNPPGFHRMVSIALLRLMLSECLRPGYALIQKSGRSISNETET
jgi:hypothetical protein